MSPSIALARIGARWSCNSADPAPTVTVTRQAATLPWKVSPNRVPRNAGRRKCGLLGPVQREAGMLASVLQPPNLSTVKVLDTIATTRVALALRTRAAGSGGRSYARTKPELFSTRLCTVTCFYICSGTVGRCLSAPNFRSWFGRCHVARAPMPLAYSLIPTTPTTSKTCTSIGFSNISCSLLTVFSRPLVSCQS